MDNIQDVLLQAIRLTEPTVLATVFHVQGSAYRKVGATMLIKKDKQTFGTISGGCLEEDLTARALLLLQNEKIKAKIIRYNMASEDDLSWGRGAGCNGIVSILLEKVQPPFTKQLQKINDFLDHGVTVQLTRNMRMLNKGTGENEQDVLVHLHFSPIQNEIRNLKKLRMKTNQGLSFEQIIKPKPRLVIFGAGKDVPFLARLAVQTGFAVTIWDWRKALLNQTTYKDIKLVFSPSPSFAAEKLKLTSQEYFLVMTHDFQMDKEILQLLMQLETINYLGVLGPKRRTKRLLAGNNHTLDKVHSPVGLTIGAEGPNEIAISILAELIACKRNMFKQEKVYLD